MKEIKNVNYGLEKIFKGAKDFLPLLGTDYMSFMWEMLSKQHITISQHLDFNHMHTRGLRLVAEK